MEKRESFDNAAELYDETRPSYTDAVIDWIIERTDIPKDETLLEIEAGTGHIQVC